MYMYIIISTNNKTLVFTITFLLSGENFYNEMDYTNGGSQLEKDIQVSIPKDS